MPSKAANALQWTYRETGQIPALGYAWGPTLGGLSADGRKLMVVREEHTGVTETTLPAAAPAKSAAPSRKFAYAWKRVRRGWQLYLLLALPLAWLFTFCYYPMYGAQIAFRRFLPGDTLWNAPWVGLAQFERFFQSHMFWTVIRNTVTISLYQLIVGFPFPIFLALSLNQVRRRWFSQSVQLITYAPYFISTVVIVGILIQILDMRRGPLNMALGLFGVGPIHFLAKPELFPSVYVWSGVWQNMGFNSVIYLAALTTIDPELHEAAVMDGASRLRRIWHIDVPGIMPVAITLLILNMGGILSIGFEKAFLLQNPLNLTTAEVISTYVYKVGIEGGFTNYSYAAAIGLLNSLVGLVMIVLARSISKALTGYDLW